MPHDLRAFIAIELPEPMQRDLDKIAVPMRRSMQDMPLRWVKIPNIHLTLKFLGQVTQDAIPAITQAMQAEAAKVDPFEMQLVNLGAFPDLNKPLVLWAGLQAPPALEDLQQGIEKAMADLGYPPEERPFKPHLTLARVRRDHRLANIKRIAELLPKAQMPPPQPVRVDAVTLFRSDLKPGGSVYNPISRASLRGKTGE